MTGKIHILLAWALLLFSVTTLVDNVENNGLMRTDEAYVSHL